MFSKALKYFRLYGAGPNEDITCQILLLSMNSLKSRATLKNIHEYHIYLWNSGDSA